MEQQRNEDMRFNVIAGFTYNASQVWAKSPKPYKVEHYFPRLAQAKEQAEAASVPQNDEQMANHLLAWARSMGAKELPRKK